VRRRDEKTKKEKGGRGGKGKKSGERKGGTWDWEGRLEERIRRQAKKEDGRRHVTTHTRWWN